MLKNKIYTYFLKEIFKSFLKSAISPELCSKYLFHQISQIFVDLFSKNNNSKIWFVE